MHDAPRASTRRHTASHTLRATSVLVAALVAAAPLLGATAVDFDPGADDAPVIAIHPPVDTAPEVPTAEGAETATTEDGDESAPAEPAASVVLGNSHAEIVGWTTTLGREHDVIVRLRDDHHDFVGGLADRITIAHVDGVPGLGWSTFTEQMTDEGPAYTATIRSAAVGMARVSVAFDGRELPGAPMLVQWTDPVDLLASHAETVGWTQPVGRPHTLLVRLRDGSGAPVTGFSDRLAVRQLDGPALEWGRVREDVVDDEHVYVVQLTADEVGQRLITVDYDNGREVGQPYGTPIPVWWHAAPASAKASSLSVSHSTARVRVDVVELEVHVRDDNGNAVTDPTDVSISSTFGVVGDSALARPGVFRATLTAEEEGHATVAFTVDGQPGGMTHAVRFEAEPATETAPDEVGTAPEEVVPDIEVSARAEDLALTGTDAGPWTALAALGALAVMAGGVLAARRRA